MRTSMKLVGGLVAVAAVVLVVLVFVVADQTERGTGAPRDQRAPSGGGTQLVAVGLASRAADDFDPAGDNREHADETAFVTDRDPNSTWSTETYQAGLGKAGVGLVVDASPGLRARALELDTPDPGFTVAVYGAAAGPPTAPRRRRRWERLGSPTRSTSPRRASASTGRPATAPSSCGSPSSARGRPRGDQRAAAPARSLTRPAAPGPLRSPTAP
jgi:hypothetical protein